MIVLCPGPESGQSRDSPDLRQTSTIVLRFKRYARISAEKIEMKGKGKGRKDKNELNNARGDPAREGGRCDCRGGAKETSWTYVRSGGDSFLASTPLYMEIRSVTGTKYPSNSYNKKGRKDAGEVFGNVHG